MGVDRRYLKSAVDSVYLYKGLFHLFARVYTRGGNRKPHNRRAIVNPRAARCEVYGLSKLWVITFPWN